VQPVLEAMYSSKVADAYKAALETAAAKRDTVIIFVKAGQTFVSDKALLVYNDGTKGLVVELRAEGFLPTEGKVTISNALEAARAAPLAVRVRAEAMAAQVMDLVQQSPALAQQKLADLHTLVLTAKDTALTRALAAKERVLTEVPLQYSLAREYATEQAERLLALAKTAPELFEQQVQELYTWLLSLTPQVREQLEAALEAAKALPAQAREQVLALPETLPTHFPAATEYYNSTVKPTVAVKWELLKAKLQETRTQANDKLDIEARWVLVQAKVEEAKAKVVDLQLVESAQALPAKAAELTEVARGKAMQVWRTFFAMVLEKLGHSGLSQEDVLEGKTSAAKDPIDAKFEEYMKEQGVNADEDSDEDTDKFEDAAVTPSEEN